MVALVRTTPEKRETTIELKRTIVDAAPSVLTPTRVETMLKARRNYQVVKFRSTCSDCVPNL
jgi:hypothetical protein